MNKQLIDTAYNAHHNHLAREACVRWIKAVEAGTGRTRAQLEAEHGPDSMMKAFINDRLTEDQAIQYFKSWWARTPSIIPAADIAWLDDMKRDRIL